MSNCSCDSYITTPTPCIPFVPSSGNCENRIRMFFGHYVKSGSNSNIFKPGQLTNLYYTKPIDNNYIQYGFRIEQYSAQELVDSGILPNGFGSDPGNNTFELTELELLAAASYESWLTFLHAELVTINPNSITNISPATNGLSFGFWVLKALDFDLKKLQELGWRTFDAMVGGDTSGFLGWIQQFLVNPPRTGSNQQPRNATYQTTIDLNNCSDLIRAEQKEKLILAYEWFKNIHDTYYGKQFLVRIGDPVPQSGTAVTYPLDTLCIKDENGFYPSLNYPYFIDGDGSAQGYYLSDVIDNGGFPDKEDTSLISLKDLDWVTGDDGKISSFCRVGSYGKINLNTKCSGLYEQILYPKFPGDPTSSGNCSYWKMDISKINSDSFILDDTSIGQNLYVSCIVSNRIYIDNEGTWVHFSLSDKIPMVPTTTTNAQGFVTWDCVMKALGAYNTTIKQQTTLEKLLHNPFNFGTSLGTLLYIYTKFFPFSSNIHGARSDTSLLNVAQTNSFCLIPEAVVIPFKSNLYRYGPFYFGDNNSGGADIIVEDDIAPWNFVEHNKSSLPVEYAFDKMKNFGIDVASSSPRDLQKLEKGRVTVAGLPCYCLSHWVDDPNCYTPDELGPTLLTDMSVEFNNGGFNTTYNFSTYTPRFGKQEKYITDAWKESIKDTQYLNKYLKTLEDQVDKSAQNYKLRLLNNTTIRQEFSSLNIYKGAKIQKDSTTHRIMFAGYEMFVNPIPSLDYPSYDSGEQYAAPSGNYPYVSDCSEYICTTPTPITFTPPVYTPPPKRLYTFADTDKAYTVEYIQNTYHQLSGMSLDGLYLPVSLRGANKDPNIKEYIKYPDSSTNANSPPNSFQLDGNNFLVPNTSWTNSARLPRFAKRCENNGQFVEWDNLSQNLDREQSNNPGYPIPSKTRDEIPPFKLNGITNENKNCYGLQINQKYLNPILSHKNLLGEQYYGIYDNVDGWDDRKNESDKGFVIGSIIFGQDHIDYQLTHTSPENKKSNSDVAGYEDQNTDEFIRQQFKNFRFPALRGPLVLQGWGYDTSGKPIPNSSDGWGHAQMGEFRKTNLTDKFMKNWLQYPKSWPVGPIDLRFDRERGVWTCPSPNKIVVARLKERLLKNGSAKAELINPEADGIRFYHNYSISGPNGEDVKLSMENTEITVYDFLGIELCQCDVIYAYYDDNRYIVLESNRSYMDPNELCADITCTTTTTTETTTTTTTTTTPTTPPCDWCGLECLQGVPNYDGGVEQVLGHDDKGCLKWFDVTGCESTPSP